MVLESTPPTVRDDEDGPQPGTTVPSLGTVLGRFLVLGPLGAGGMGVVLAAYDPELDRKVAIKLLRPDLWSGREATARARLTREAQTMARLAHPNVVAVYEVGSAGDQMFLVMELVPGQTLRQYLASAHEDPNEVLRLVCAAGDGLAAAHRAGVVHRDFKPDNVLIGADGRARVTDFGLAAAVRDAEESATGAHHTDARAGTAGYMSPEQIFGEPSNARSDQYAFCVTLHEALHGALPSAGTVTFNRRVPPHVREAIARGLSTDAAARWPSMDALLARLRRDPRVPRQRAAVAIAAAAAIGTAAFVVGRREAPASLPVCAGAEQRIAEVWDDGDRARVQAAFLATGVPYAASTFDRVDRAIQGRQAGWAAAYRDACEATHVRGMQSEALLDLRMNCLTRARAELAAVVDVFARADATTVENAASAATSAGDFDACANGAALGAMVPRPSAPEKAQQLRDLEAHVAALEADYRTRRLVEGLAKDDAVIAAARELGWAPLLAEALRLSGELEREGGDANVAEARLQEAIQTAGAGRADLTLAEALRNLIWLLAVRQQRSAEAAALVPVAWAAHERSGADETARARMLLAEGHALSGTERHAEALAKRREALVGLERVHGPDSTEINAALLDVGSSLGKLERYEEALAHLERAVRLAEQGFGPEHPRTATAWGNLGSGLVGVGDLEGAARAHEKALALRERLFGNDHWRVALSLHNLALVRLAQGHNRDARTLLERAVAIRERLGANNIELAASLNVLSSALRCERRYDQALALAERALAIRVAVLGPEHSTTAASYQSMGLLALEQGRRQEARAQYEHALRIYTKVGSPDSLDSSDVKVRLAQIDLEEGRHDAALRSLRGALANYERSLPADHPRFIHVLIPLTDALIAGGDVAAAVATAERARRVAQTRALQGGADGRVRFTLARALWASGTREARAHARTLVREARALLVESPEGEELARLDRWVARHP